ncbi:MAG: hypothetical protein ACKVPX_04730 [Myxococcaceae bacterium]
MKHSRSTFAFLMFTVLATSSGLAAPLSASAPPAMRENDLDRRFVRTRLYRALYMGVADPVCAPALGGLMTLVGEAGPLIHARDENFVLDETLLAALQTQLTTAQFPGSTYFTLMMRRIRLEGRLPPQWLDTAARLQPMVGTIDLGKLRMLAEGVKPIFNATLSLPALRNRYEVDVLRASSAAGASAWDSFRDTYLDHEVAWGELVLVDVQSDVKVPTGDEDATPVTVNVATADWLAPDPNEGTLSLAPPKPRAKIRVHARLTPRQYMDVSKLPKGHRVLLRGRLWEMTKNLTEVELRDAVLFEDRNWSQGTLLANPEALGFCPIAVNDLTGTAGGQPGGFGH